MPRCGGGNPRVRRLLARDEAYAGPLARSTTFRLVNEIPLTGPKVVDLFGQVARPADLAYRNPG